MIYSKNFDLIDNSFQFYQELKNTALDKSFNSYEFNPTLEVAGRGAGSIIKKLIESIMGKEKNDIPNPVPPKTTVEPTPAPKVNEKIEPPKSTPILPKSAATELENLTGKTRVEAKEYLEKAGFEYKGSTAGGYDKFYHPDGSKVQIRPDGEVVRTGPKIKSAEGKSYNPRVDQHGQFTQTHNTGEVLKK
jgi:hypothetical protein